MSFSIYFTNNPKRQYFQMNEQKNAVMKNVIFIFLLLSVLFVFVACGKETDSTNSSVSLVGFVNKSEKTLLATFDYESDDFTILKEYPLFAALEECSLNLGKMRVAYTKWNEDGDNRKLVIEELDSGNIVEYYTDKGLSISNPLFVDNDGIQLVFKKTILKDGFPQESICIFNTVTGEEKKIRETLSINTVKIDDDDNRIYGIEQRELDVLLGHYGGQPVSLDETGSRIFVKFSAPFLGADGNVYYSASLYRNAAKQGTGLVIASGIWRYRVLDGESERLYGASGRRMVGRMSVNPMCNMLLFVECFLITGEESSIMCFDMKTGETKEIITPSPDRWANLDPVFISENEFTYLSVSKGKNEQSAVRYLYNLVDNAWERIEVTYNGNVELLRSFSVVID
jgi:hypothetical protein